MTVDEELLLEAMRQLQDSGTYPNAEEMSQHLGPYSDQGGYIDPAAIAADFAELEAIGRLQQAPSVDWGADTPATRIRYMLPGTTALGG
jgi:hypothetical protein